MSTDENFIILIIEILEVNDQQTFADYRNATDEINVKYGAQPLARGMDVFEGTPQGLMRMVSKWPSKQAFLDFQASPEYKELKEVRMKSAKANFIICDPV